MSSRKAYIPGVGHFGLARNTRGTVQGKGIGSVLLDGGMGGTSSYANMEDYVNTTGVMRGNGLGKSITSKLGRLTIQKEPTKRKPKNINFTL